jgi:hypothetical protein
LSFKLYPARFTGICSQASGFEQPDGPQIFINPEFFRFCHKTQKYGKFDELLNC